MRLTDRTDFAMRVLMVLGASGKRHTVPSLAGAFHVSAHHLTKVVQALQAQGWVETTPGRAGGVKLADAAQSITVGDVVRAIEPDFELVECFRAQGQCPLAQPCALADLLKQARDAFLEQLDSVLLTNLFAAREQKLLNAVPMLVNGTGGST